MPIPESTLSKWSHHEAGTAFKEAHLPIRAALRRQAAPGLDVPSEPYLLGDLAIDYAQRREIVVGVSVDLSDVEFRLLAELSANAPQIMTHEQLLRRSWGQDSAGGSGPVRTIVKSLRRTGDSGDNPSYIFNKRRVGYRMERGERSEQ